MVPSIQVWADVTSDATASRIADRLARAIRDEAPDISITRERSDSRTQELGSIVGILLTHAAIVSVVEGVKLVWDLHREPLKIQCPDGSVIQFRGDIAALRQRLQQVADSLSGS